MEDNSDNRNEKIAVPDSPITKERKFRINFPRAIVEFESVLRKFPVKKILYNTLFQSRGLEFESYRAFESSDDANTIDWKASLRANTLLTRRYIREGDLNVYFIVDVSNSMLFGSGEKLKAEYSAEMVCALGHLIISSGDRIGLVMFSDDIVKILPPASGKNQLALFMKYLSDTKFYGGGFDLRKTLDSVLQRIGKSYNVFIIVSDFINTQKNAERMFRLIGSRFETIAVMIRDLMDENLPKTNYQFAFKDPYSNRQMILDPEIAAERYKWEAARQKNMMREIFKKSRIDLLELMTNKSFAYPTAAFLKARAIGGGRI